MKNKLRTSFNPKAVIAEAESGCLSFEDVRRRIRDAERFNSHEALTILRRIEQQMLGQRAGSRSSGQHAPGSAAWAYAQFNAAPKTPYSWAALDVQGHVVINLWDDDGGWGQDSHGHWYPAHPHGAKRNPSEDEKERAIAKGTRTEFFKLLEVASASHSGLVRAILSTAVDPAAIPRKRLQGSSRPWLNEDDSPVVLRINALDIRRKTYSLQLADAARRPRSPFRQ